MSHISSTRPYSSWKNFIPTRICVVVSGATGENDYIQFDPGTFIYPLTMLLDFKRIYPSGYSLILNTHFTVTAFLPLDFNYILLIGTQIFLDIKWLISETADIYHECSIGLEIYSLRVLGYPASVEIEILHNDWISSYLCSKIRMTRVSPVNLYFTSMIGSYAFVIVRLQA